MKYNIFVGFIFVSVFAFGQTTSDTVSRVYTLGEVSVFATRSGTALSGKVGDYQMRRFNRDNVTDALNLLPGLTVTEAGARGEEQVCLRGFSLLQTPVYYDGIPVYVPYDGNVDITRFATYDVGQISVSKALTSLTYGPNTMGGAINIVSRKPVKALEIWGLSGIRFGKNDFGKHDFDKNDFGGYVTAVSAGARKEKYYVLCSFSYRKQNFFSLSNDFIPGTNEDGGRRENSDSYDMKFSAKTGYTPNATDEYSLNLILQKAEKGIPTAVEGSQFRRYPQYDKRSLYYKSTTALGASTTIDITAYYDNYYNILGQYDDNTFTLQNSNKSFTSVYDDNSLGGAVNFSSTCLKNNVLKFSLYEKYDLHRENNDAIPPDDATGQSGKSGEPAQKYIDNTVSVGVEDIYSLTEYLDLIAGISYSYRANNKAQEYGTHYQTGVKNVLYDFETGSDDALNYQFAAIFKFSGNHKLSLSASRKSRFASQKERYSSRFGSALPNPDLKSEFSWIFDLTYSGQIGKIFQYEISVFRNNIDNAIYSVGTDSLQSNGDPVTQSRNVGKSYAEGFEFSFGLNPASEVSFGGNYSYIKRRNKNEPELKVIDVPENKVLLYARYNPPHLGNTYLHIDWEAYGKRYITGDGETVPGYGLLNAKIHAAVWSGLSIEAGVRNACDKNYFISSYNYPREGRTYFVNTVYDF
jgi:iron complex outermembrane receptor protein